MGLGSLDAATDVFVVEKEGIDKMVVNLQKRS